PWRSHYPPTTAGRSTSTTDPKSKTDERNEVMAKKQHVVEVGDRFETRDGRDTGRVVEVIEVLGLTRSAAKHIDQLIAKGDRGGLEDHVARVRARSTYVRVR